MHGRIKKRLPETISTGRGDSSGAPIRERHTPFPVVMQQHRTRSARRYKLNSIFCWRLLETATPLLIAGVNR